MPEKFASVQKKMYLCAAISKKDEEICIPMDKTQVYNSVRNCISEELNDFEHMFEGVLRTRVPLADSVIHHIGQHARNLQRTCGIAAIKAFRQEEVTHQHSDLVVPNLIDGFTTTTCRTLIDDIVVHQCGIVEQL